jgi:hypothetical protein
VNHPGCWGVPEHFLPLSDHSCGDLLSIVVEQTSLRLQENLPPQTHPSAQHLGRAPSAYLNIRYALAFSASKRRNFNWSRRELTDRNNRTRRQVNQEMQETRLGPNNVG